jgi:HAD superfamily hydrolase (TIGR01509 family)
VKAVARLLQALQGKELLIFDFDGTVADTTPLHAAAFVQALAPLGIPVDYPSISGLKTLDAMRQCLDVVGRILPDAQVQALVVEKQKLVRQMITQGLEPLPGVDEFLCWARPRYRLAMATSGSRGTVSLALEKLGYNGWFEPLVCADEVSNGKPDPACFLQVLAMTGVSASESLIFEDSDAGMAAAQSAGVACFDVSSTSFAMYSLNWS